MKTRPRTPRSWFAPNGLNVRTLPGQAPVLFKQPVDPSVATASWQPTPPRSVLRRRWTWRNIPDQVLVPPAARQRPQCVEVLSQIARVELVFERLNDLKEDFDAVEVQKVIHDRPRSTAGLV